eukprot:gene6035-5904_t
MPFRLHPSSDMHVARTAAVAPHKSQELPMIFPVAMLLVKVSSAVGADADSGWDVCVYGATPAGFAAAVAARDMGVERVGLIEPTSYVGGMASPGGIGLRDCEDDRVRTNNASQFRWGMRNAAFYGVSKPVWQPDNWLGQRTFLEMLGEAGVDLHLNTSIVEGPAGVRLDGTRITALQLEATAGGAGLGWRTCAYVIDASYEGDVLVAAGASYTFGREALSQYNESLGGVTGGSINQFGVPVNPFVDPADPRQLLPWVSGGADPSTRLGAADDNLMAYSYRACLTTDIHNK